MFQALHKHGKLFIKSWKRNFLLIPIHRKSTYSNIILIVKHTARADAKQGVYVGVGESENSLILQTSMHGRFYKKEAVTVYFTD